MSQSLSNNNLPGHHNLTGWIFVGFLSSVLLVVAMAAALARLGAGVELKLTAVRLARAAGAESPPPQPLSMTEPTVAVDARGNMGTPANN